MTTDFKTTFLLIAALSVSPFGTAQEVLRLGDAIQKMINQNREISAEKLKISQSEFQADNSFNQLLPSLKLTGRYSKLSEVDPFTLQSNPLMAPVEVFPSITNQSGLKLTMTQPVFTGFKLQNAVTLTEHNHKAAVYDYQTKLSDNIVRLAQTYFSVLSGERSLDIVRKNVLQLKKRVNDAELMRNQGLLTENDVLKIKLKLSELEVSALLVEDNVKVSAMNLNIQLGEPADRFYQLEIPALLTTVADESVRPEIAGMNEKLEALKAAGDIARGDYYPSLSLQINYDIANPNQRYFPQKEEWNNSWDISLVMSYDLWSWNTRSNNVQIADAGYKIMEHNKTLLSEALSVERKSAELAIERTKKSIDVMKKLVEQTSLNLKYTENQFTAGLVTTTDVLDAQIQHLQAELQLVQVQLDHQLNEFKLLKSRGTILKVVSQQ